MPKKIKDMTVEEFAGSDCPSVNDYAMYAAEVEYEETGFYPWEEDGEDHTTYEEPTGTTYFTINEDNYTEEF